VVENSLLFPDKNTTYKRCRPNKWKLSCSCRSYRKSG